MNRGALQDATETVFRRLGEEVRDEIVRRRAMPCVWALFHRNMLATLPRWRVIARAIHRAGERRMVALCKANGNPDKLCV
ncbi:MAG: hypothetical protein K0U78_16305 [Actinomycetia bacterium]|nr:hypothetical protein [Actinomycetes bacterium]